MKCNKCKTEYEGDFCPNGCDSSKENATKKKKPIFKKWWFWLIVVIVIILIGSSGGGEEPSDETVNSEQSVAMDNTAQEPTDETVGVEDSKEQNDNIYNVGDVIEANGLNITYVGAEKWEGYNQFMAPEDGYMYIRIKVSAQNTAKTDRYFSMFEFNGYADGVKVDTHYESEGALAGGTISSGRSTEGYIYFSVPISAQEIEIEYETSFWTDQKAILKVVL